MAQRGRVVNDIDVDDEIDAWIEDEPEDWEDDDEPAASVDVDDVRSADDTVPLLAAAAEASRSWYRGGLIDVGPATMTCRVCGCTDHHGCAGGCVWVAPSLCSRCVRGGGV